MQLRCEPGRQDGAERPGVFEERRDENENRLEGDELVEPPLDRESGEDIDGTGEQQHRQALIEDPPAHTGRPQHSQDQGDDADHGHDGTDADGDVAVADGERGQEETRQRDDVAGGGDERAGDVVDVPTPGDREARHHHRDGAHEHR